MNKKIVGFFGICIILLIGCILYFHPIYLPEDIMEDNYLTVQITRFVVQNGESDIDTKSYNNITEEQKREIIDLIQDYSYKRTLKTYISDNAMDDIGDRIVFIYIYDSNKIVESVYVSDSGQISVNDRIYKMKNAEQFNESIENIFK